MRDLGRFVAAFVLMSAFFTSPTSADTNVSGTIGTDTTWLASASPYVVIDSVTVSNGRTLTIEPGVTVKFNTGKYLYVAGRLLAVGTSTSPITFTASAASPTRGSWGYIDIQAGSNPASELAYATIWLGGSRRSSRRSPTTGDA